MTAAIASGEGALDRAEQLEQLRRRIAAISGKVGPRWAAPEPFAAVVPASQSLLPVPDSLAGVLPGGLPRGAVAVLSGARSLAVGLTASVSAAGGNVAVVGLPDFGLLAAAEMGADLSRLATQRATTSATVTANSRPLELDIRGGTPVAPDALDAQLRAQGY